MAISSCTHTTSEDALLPVLPPVWGRRFESDRLFVELCPRQPYQVRYQPNWHVLGIALETQSGYHAFASDRISPYHAPANTFAFTPARCETFSESDRGGAYLIFALSEELFETYVSDIAPSQSLSLRRLSHLHNQHITAIGRAAQKFIQTHPSGGRLYFEALAAQFATHVILALLSKPEVTIQGKLPERSFDYLLEFVEANLCEDLSLSALAEVVEMPPSQFVRWFKAKVGQSPHAWVITCRLNRAKTLLAKTEQAIAQIAFDCGFSSQSHMTTLFSRYIGITPKQYRERRQLPML
jgi:AraC family transcriptional regulator